MGVSENLPWSREEFEQQLRAQGQAAITSITRSTSR